jgi:serine/threonine protein kinase
VILAGATGKPQNKRLLKVVELPGQEAGQMADLEGTSLGPYQIQALLGTGGMGQVYRAHDPRLGREVAIKVLAAPLAQEPGSLERFRREARAVAQLYHPHIVPIYDFGEQDTLMYLVMPFISGGTLREILTRHGTLPLSEAYAFFEPLADALQYAHERGLIHRDVKPANVLLNNEGGALLTDFGIARLARRDVEATTLTSPGAFVGSPAYAAPEMVLEEEVDHRVDVYALGVLLFQMLTGRLPFAASSALAVLMMQVEQPPPAPRRLNPAIPPAVEAVVLQALAKAPAERYPSMAAFAAALRSASSAHPLADIAAQSILPEQTVPLLPEQYGLTVEAAAPFSMVEDLPPLEQEPALAASDRGGDTSSLGWDESSGEAVAVLSPLGTTTSLLTLPDQPLVRGWTPTHSTPAQRRLLSGVLLTVLLVGGASLALLLGGSHRFFSASRLPGVRASVVATATPTPTPSSYYAARNWAVMPADLQTGDTADSTIYIYNSQYIVHEGPQGDLYQMGDAVTFGRAFGTAQIVHAQNGTAKFVVLVDRFLTYQEADHYFMRDQALFQGKPTTIKIGEQADAAVVLAANGLETYQLFFRDRNMIVTIALVPMPTLPRGLSDYFMSVGESMAARAERCLYDPLTNQALPGNPSGCA